MSRALLKKYDVGIVGSGPVGLVLSGLLNHYGVSHVLIDRRVEPVLHPQAHFLNARTMEILQSNFPEAHKTLVGMMQDSDKWRYDYYL